jgi:hypothetical protein
MPCLDCSNCESLGVFDICQSVVYLGVAPQPDTEYTVMITDVTTGEKVIYTDETDSDGLFKLQPSSQPRRDKTFTTGRTYEVKLFALNSGFNTPLAVSPVGDPEQSETCWSFEFMRFDNVTPEA